MSKSIATRSTLRMLPEGPEVRTLVNQLQGGVGQRLLDFRFFSGRYMRNSKPFGFFEFAATMTPTTPPAAETDNNDTSVPIPVNVDVIQSWKAKGKFIYIILDDGNKVQKEDIDLSDFQRSIWITLGMTGKFVSEKVHSDNPSHGRWYMELLDCKTHKKTKIHYHDMRNFGTLKFCLSKKALQEKLGSLGPDILDPNNTIEDVFVDIVRKKKPDLNICKFLMNQGNICGIGNYILAEGLYRANIDPFASLQELSEIQHRSLFRELQSVALQSFEAQGMTRRQGGVYATVDGSNGKFEVQLQCYGRKWCPRGDPVIQETKGPHGRTIWYTQQQLFMPLDKRYSSKSGSTGASTLCRTIRHNNPTPAKSGQIETSEKVDAEVRLETGWEVFHRESKRTDNAELLLSTLTDSGWRSIIQEMTEESISFQGLTKFLQSEISAGKTIYPPHSDVFASLNISPLDRIKVVVCGQDPYHGPGQGHGLAFSVRRNVLPPPSLKNIFKEVIDDIGIDPPGHGNLECWAKQGVLMLNNVLTVRRGEANSHKNKGWEEFTDSIIQHLSDNKEGLVFLLWGNPAHKKASNVDESKHTLIRTSHPSPLGATKTNAPFLGSRCFSRCNEALQKSGKAPIDWSVQ